MAKNDWIGPAIGAAAAGYAAYSNSKNARKDREQAAEENDIDRRYQAAVRESELNPYRHDLSQAQTLSALDLIARGGYSAPKISLPGIDVPQITGGFEYTPNPDMAVAAKRLQQKIAAGQGAPTMTDPNNWGQTGSLDLNAPVGGAAARPGTAVPRGGAAAVPTRTTSPTVGPASGGGFDAASLLAATPRRNEGAGGVWSNAAKGAGIGMKGGYMGAAAGALIGGAVGAFTKNAKTAATDVSVDQARNIIAQAIQQLEGRSPSPDEVTEILRGQGWQPGHRWVGEAGLTSVLRDLQQNASSRQPQSGALAASYDTLFQ